MEDELPKKVGDPSGVDEKGCDGLTGNKQVAFEEKAGAGENDGDVAEVEEVYGAPGVPVGGNPDRKPNYGGPAQDARIWLGRESRDRVGVLGHRRPWTDRCYQQNGEAGQQASEAFAGGVAYSEKGWD